MGLKPLPSPQLTGLSETAITPTNAGCFQGGPPLATQAPACVATTFTSLSTNDVYTSFQGFIHMFHGTNHIHHLRKIVFSLRKIDEKTTNELENQAIQQNFQWRSRDIFLLVVFLLVDVCTDLVVVIAYLVFCFQLRRSSSQPPLRTRNLSFLAGSRTTWVFCPNELLRKKTGISIGCTKGS